MLSLEIMGTDERTLHDQVLAQLEESLGQILNPGDERRIVAETLLSVVYAALYQGGAYAQGQLIRYASGQMLDRLGELLGVTRLPAECAKTTLEFSTQAPAGVTVMIPKGTRVTADGVLFFATEKDVSAPFDTPTIQVSAVALDAGTIANGIPAGSITTIVDPMVYVSSVKNIIATSGGVDTEDDEAFRERIREAPASFSVAGPAGAYRYWAMSADPSIGDVSVQSPEAVEVVVTVLLKGGQIPEQDVLDKVTVILSADDVRPLTDQVTVQAATAQEYTITGDYYISETDASDETQIKAAVAAALEEYKAWQSERLGRSINPDELRRRVLTAGACRMDLTSPIYEAVEADKVAVASAASALTYKGRLS